MNPVNASRDHVNQKLASLRVLVIAMLVIMGLTASVLGQAHVATISKAAPLDNAILTPTCVPYPAPGQPFCSPPATPTKSPSPSPIPGPSAEAKKALAHIATTRGIPISALSVIVDHPTQYPNLGRKFQVVTLLDQRPSGRFYSLLVDLADGRIEENIYALLSAESQARQTRYGKLEPALLARLQTIKDDDLVRVAVWIVAPASMSLNEQQQIVFAQLVAKYPLAKTAMDRSGKPMDVSDSALARRIEADYVSLMNAGMNNRVQSLLTDLAQRGFTLTTYDGMPSFAAVLPKRTILEISQREDVGAIYLIETREQPTLDTAMPTILAPVVWGRGYNGTGIAIAILEGSNVALSNTYLNHGAIRNGVGDQNHPTLVASAAASFHDTFRGVAWGATVLSAGHDGTEAGAVQALQWAIDQDAYVINRSAVFGYDNNLNWLDRAFDYWARYRSRFIATSAGNSGAMLGSPAKGWNVITVGGFDDRDDPDWSNDRMWAGSSWINPVSPHSDHEKSEVVAVGDTINALGINNTRYSAWGTSLSSPMVAGLAALGIQRNPYLWLWPEANRAIIMASATHNITGTTGILTGQDLVDGAGGINAALADTIAQTRNLSQVDPCTTSCWWAYSIDNIDFPVGTWQYRYFTANAGDVCRAAIVWWSNPDSSYGSDSLDTDLNFGIVDPDGSWVPGAFSASWDNNYELVEWTAPKTGTYRIAIYKVRADEWSNYIGIALLRQSMTYLPIVLNSP